MGYLDKEMIIEFLASSKYELQERFGVVKLGLFGSFSRGDARLDSDNDI